MRKLLFILFVLSSLSGFGQIVRTLNNVSNTADSLRPISKYEQTALNLKADAANFTNVNNTTDANKPVSTATATALGLKQNSISGTGLARFTGATVSFDNSAYITGITSGNVTTALGFTPYNATNPSGYISSVPAQSFASLTTKPTTLSGYGITDSYPLTGNPSAFLTTVSSSNVTTALGFTPYNATNPSGFISATTASSTYSTVASPLHTGDIETTTVSAGVIVKSPNGTRFRLSVSNTGDIIATSL